MQSRGVRQGDPLSSYLYCCSRNFSYQYPIYKRGGIILKKKLTVSEISKPPTAKNKFEDQYVFVDLPIPLENCLLDPI